MTSRAIKELSLAVDDEGKAEIFLSLQGEGPKIGRPSIFIRLSECNLYCKWCDTAYTWNWEGTEYQHDSDEKFKKTEQQIAVSLETIKSTVSNFNCRHIIFTGGEPLVQQKRLEELIEFYGKSKFGIEFETNGTIIPTALIDKYVSMYVVSPKLANSGVEREDRVRENAIDYFSKSDNAYFKFVVANETDLNEVESFTSNFSINHNRVYLMPRASTLEGLKVLEKYVAEQCIKRGYFYSDRLHLRLYGGKRGT